MGLLNSTAWTGVQTDNQLPKSDWTGAAATDQNGNPFISANTENYTGMLQGADANQVATQQAQRGLQSNLVGEIQGTGPNLGLQLLNQATNANIAQTAGGLASARGLNPAQAARLISQEGTTNQQELVGQAGTERMNEQLNAQNQLGGLLSQEQTGNLTQSGQAITGNTSQNAQALQNQQLQQQLAQTTAAQNAGLKSTAQGQDMGAAQTAANAAGKGLDAIGGLIAPAVAAAASHGARVPGEPSTVDTEPYMLAKGELVVPAHIADNPIAVAAYAMQMKRLKGN